MKKTMILISVILVMVGCANTNARNPEASLTPLNDRYGKPRVSPTAKKALKGELAKNDDNDVVCRKVKKTGSSIPVITCKTVAERRFDNKRSKESVERLMNDFNKFQPVIPDLGDIQ